MESIVGIFTTRAEAENAVNQLRSADVTEDHINLLTPGSPQQISDVPTTEAEQPGPGGAIGSVVGGALGAAGGMTLGAAAATMFLPGIGWVFIMGLLGASIFGAGGALGGAAIGEAMDNSLGEGVVADELFFYEDALRQGHSVVIISADGDEKANLARQILSIAGAEGIDSARENWWIGLRDAEKEHYIEQGHPGEWDESSYRSGFEAALHPKTRGKNHKEAASFLEARYPQAHRKDPFLLGYERGQAYLRSLAQRGGGSSQPEEKE